MKAQRIVALDYFQGIAHDLGAPLVGRSDYLEPWKDDDATYANLPAADGEADLADVEKITVLRPDLVLGSTDQIEAVRDELKRLCAVVEVPGEFTLQWRDMCVLIAEAAGLPSPAGVLEEIDRRTREIAERRPPDLRTAAIIRPSEAGEFRLYGPDIFRGDLVTAAGLEVFTLGATTTTEDVSVERLADVRADLIFLWNDRPGQPDLAGLRSSLEQNPLWALLPAVAAGRVVKVDFHWIGNDPESADLT